MIESISIAANTASFRDSAACSPLKQFNYFFGSNGSGKTTISRIIANSDSPDYAACSINWKNRIPLRADVYNSDFIVKNFHQQEELKGIFTLGSQDAQLVHDIAATKNKFADAQQEKIKFENTLGNENENSGKIGELFALKNEFKEQCWKVLKRHEEHFKSVFKGVLRKELFQNKVLQELDSNSAELLGLEELKNKVEALFKQEPELESKVHIPAFEALLAFEKEPILQKKVIGASDVDIAGMIERLGNSDWVRQGKVHFEKNHGICPFCQQQTDEKFAKDLKAYFDTTYTTDLDEIQTLSDKYDRESIAIERHLQTILHDPNPHLNKNEFGNLKTIVIEIIKQNKAIIESKLKEPSLPVALGSLENAFKRITDICVATNDLVDQHNNMVTNLKQEQKKAEAQVWRYLLEKELPIVIQTYFSKENGLKIAIEQLKAKILKAKQDVGAIERELQVLEMRTTSVQPTIDKINTLLKSFGFSNFSIQKTESGPFYQLLRPNGELAKETLSEGEKTFVAFLYFYFLLSGSHTESGVSDDRIAVIDDPISSLDADILFIVSTLIRDLIEKSRKGESQIRQIIILTHNVYFFKEVTFNKKNAINKDKSFWIVRKTEQTSYLEQQLSNPIKTTYELLWSTLKQERVDNIAVQNAMRRILEYYFKMLGGIDLENIEKHFEGQQKQICHSLVSWVHDGSHSIAQGLDYSVTDNVIRIYREVFEEIFENEGHGNHYKMMMGII